MIRSRSNPLVKQARALRQTKVREETGLFIVEGIHHVGEAMAAGWPIEAILFAPELLTSKFALGMLSRASHPPEPVSADVMEYLAGKDNPQGIIAVVRKRHLSLNGLRLPRCGVALVAPQDPGNLGTILRSLDAVGGDVLLQLEGGVDPYHPTAIRASMGATFWKPIVAASLADFKKWKNEQHIYLIGASSHAPTDYRQASAQEPWLLVCGSEQKGLTPDQLQECDLAVSLPMRGRSSSLNLAVAVSILLYYFA